MKLFGNPIKGLVKTMLAFGFMSAMGVTPLFAQATNTLAGLVANNGTLTIGDKIFSGFSYTASGLTSFNPTNIIVTATGSNGIDYLTWSGNISLVSTGITSAVLLLKYIVTANRGVINMIDQSYSGSVTNGLLSVDETATSPGAPTAHSHLDAGFGPPDVSDPNVYPNGPFDIGENDLLSIVPAQTTLHVTKAISPAVISPSGGSVTITQVEQSFHQNSGTLANLVANNGTLTIGDKTFTNFTFEVTGLNSFNPTNIIVTATESNGVDYLTWSGNISLASGGFVTASLSLNYTVTANSGSISMIDQRYTGSVTNGSVLINETATSAGAPIVHSQLSVNDVSDPNTYPSGPFDVGENDLLSVTPPQTTLYVNKGISLVVIGGSITITQVEQSFHQNSGTLANLVANNGTLTIGDKTFTNFTFEVTGLNSFNPTNIIVTATESNGVDYLTWSGNISLVSTGIATANLLLNYIVTANRGVINMIDQSYAGSTTNGLLSVDETAATDAFGGTVVGYSHLQIGDTNDPPAEPVQGDNLNVNPAQSVLYVTKAIGFGVISTSGGSVTITQVEQSFHQVIPPTLAIQLVNPTNPMMVKVLWPSSSTNWTLWQNTNLVTTNWSSNSLSISNDNTNKSITVSPATGNLFFRLSNP